MGSFNSGFAFGLPSELEERFWIKVVRKESGCWEWNAGCNLPPALPYGRFKFHGKEDKSHRVSWKIIRGEIPKGMWVLHRCDNPMCVSPFHLFIGTPKDNAVDSSKKGRRSKAGNPWVFGEMHSNSKLTYKQVKYIRNHCIPNSIGGDRRTTTGRGISDMAKRFGVSNPVIRSILNGRTWRHTKTVHVG
jgi:hypothetical protein